MKKRFLHRINILLGLLSMTLAGCHTHKNVVKDSNPQPAPEAVRSEEVVALYGVRMPVEEAPDTTATPPRPMLKYGVPRLMEDK